MLRESGFATVRPDGARRLYAVDAHPLREVDAWIDGFRRFWTPRLAALDTEIARGKRAHRAAPTELSDNDHNDTPTGTSRTTTEHPEEPR